MSVSSMLAQLHPRIAPWWAAQLEQRKKVEALVVEVMKAAGIDVPAA